MSRLLGIFEHARTARCSKSSYKKYLLCYYHSKYNKAYFEIYVARPLGRLRPIHRLNIGSQCSSLICNNMMDDKIPQVLMGVASNKNTYAHNLVVLANYQAPRPSHLMCASAVTNAVRLAKKTDLLDVLIDLAKINDINVANAIYRNSHCTDKLYDFLQKKHSYYNFTYCEPMDTEILN